LAVFVSVNNAELLRPYDSFSEWRLLMDANCSSTMCTSLDLCSCSDNTYKPTYQIFLEWLLIVLLITLSALFSGLTLGLMSLDKVGLEIVIGADPDSDEAKYATVIQPWRNMGNQLLCTLLLGNVSVNSMLSIFLSTYTSGTIGFISSTFLIVIFGEILPQATCSRHALWVGAKTIYLLIFFFYLFWIISKPLSMILDCMFEKEIGSIYSSKELSQLVQIHNKHQRLDDEQALIMGGAIEYKTKTVKDVYTPMNKVFMLEVDSILDFTLMSLIFQKGFSRLPVYQNGDRNDICGLLFSKDLILIDPEECTTVRSVIQFFGRPIQWLWPDTSLQDALTLFKTGRAHLAIVRTVNSKDESRDPYYEVAGLVTIEDIIEEILQSEILDETDLDVQVQGAPSLVDRETFDFARLKLLDTHRKNTLLPDEAKAIVAHCSVNLPIVSKALEDRLITREQITAMIELKPVLELTRGEKLYTKGKPVTHCTLILNGKMDIVSGQEGFRSSVGPWSFIGQGALNSSLDHVYIADYDAVVTSEDVVRCIRIHRKEIDELFKSHISSFELDKTKKISMIQDGENN